jgi:hypothetical protein
VKYTGKLAKPIVSKQLGLFATDADIKAEALRITTEKVNKISALFALHGVELNDWMNLAFELAEAHVPGFKVNKPAGRPTVWGKYYEAEFKLTVDSMKAANHGMTVTTAIRRVMKLDSWSVKTKGMKIAALSKHYYAADPRVVAMMKDAKAYELIVKGD